MRVLFTNYIDGFNRGRLFMCRKQTHCQNNVNKSLVPSVPGKLDGCEPGTEHREML
jgi:hypothetical protein